MKKTRKWRRGGKDGRGGFTLVELLVVVVIIAVLASFAMPRYGRYIEKAKMGEAITNLGSAGGAAEGFLAQNGEFPADEGAVGLTDTTEWNFGSDGTTELNAARLTGDFSNAVITFRRQAGGNWCWAYARGGNGLPLNETAVPQSKCCSAGCT